MLGGWLGWVWDCRRQKKWRSWKTVKSKRKSIRHCLHYIFILVQWKWKWKFLDATNKSNSIEKTRCGIVIRLGFNSKSEINKTTGNQDKPKIKPTRPNLEAWRCINDVWVIQMKKGLTVTLTEQKKNIRINSISVLYEVPVRIPSTPRRRDCNQMFTF